MIQINYRPISVLSRKAKEGLSEDHMAADGGERNATDGKDLEQHFSHGERPAEVEGSSCCPTRHPAGMSE